ncbi:hypothetical protein VIN01S_31030 [Vibrio inusitatus NBRC 102082]|uniref:Polysaccharide biosynthesis protein n=1 Tax=Vibrio inusitatus NBRC 102082 TaxID=1219070 RepID=A0A4Y3HYP0_9VIBR|nr:hypothetical protein [Vibrio inusitatus]GEA52299.1 hypothetical protein VIN01S_31030 [Vibrio inusitatus NBRC 102082]
MKNYILRGYSLFIKMIFIIFVAKNLSILDVANYGLFNGYLALFVFLCGFEFYTYTQREIINYPDMFMSLIKGHVKLVLAIFAIFVLVFMSFWSNDLELSYEIVVLLLLVTFLELISQDIGRFLIALNKIDKSTFVFFVRSGLWPTLSLLLMVISDDFKDLFWIYSIWIFTALLSIIIGIKYLDLSMSFFKVNVPPRSWYIKGMKIAVIYILSALFIKLALSFDRVIIGKFGTKEALASYVLFIGMGMSIQSFIAATVFPFSLRDLTRSYANNNTKKFLNSVKELVFKTLSFSLIMALSLYVVSPYLLNWIDNQEYIDNINYLHYILVLAISFTFAMMSHQVIYSMRLDKEVLFVRVFLMFLSMIVAYVCKVYLPNRDIVIVVSLSLSFIFVVYMVVNTIIFFREVVCRR